MPLEINLGALIFNLTLTRVVFECQIFDKIHLENTYLTLTRVVFECPTTGKY